MASTDKGKSLLVWRIEKKKHIDSALSGEGAFRNGGRWNSHGTPLVYTSSSLALAALEILVGVSSKKQLRFISYMAIKITIPASVVIDTINNADLPADWNHPERPSSPSTFGDEWVAKKKSVALRVPSAVIPLEYNYLINPFHTDFSALIVADPVPFAYDPRITGAPS